MQQSSYIYQHAATVQQYYDNLKPDKPLISSLEKWKPLFPFFDHISNQNAVLVLLWDLSTSRFIYASDKRNIVGYDLTLYTAENGIHFSMNNIHPDWILSAMLFQKTASDCMIEKRETTMTKMVVNFDGKYKRSNGQYFNFLQQSVVAEKNEQHEPTVFLSYIHDVTYMKKEGTANFILTSPEEIIFRHYNFDKQCLEPVHPFSEQEKKVLRLLSEGKQSKEIAGLLFISPHTVDTHRRNLLNKTNCTDTTGLITYSKIVGLI
jgi:DNA-binding CsgD family transcriptional regulator